MSHEAVDSWIKNAKTGLPPAMAEMPQKGLRIIVNADANNKGGLILELAESLRPWIARLLDGVRDKDGMSVQPASVKGIALNVAQELVNKQQKKLSA